MLKIPIEVNFFAGGFRPMLNVILSLENPKVFLPVKGIIDTGSPTTLIGIADMKRMRLSKIQINKVLGKKGEINIGGGKVETIKLENMGIRIGSYLETQLDVQFPIRGEDEKQPTLLGVDFLLKTKAKFCFNPSKKEAYLEIED
jgi:hypothetical protein